MPVACQAPFLAHDLADLTEVCEFASRPYEEAVDKRGVAALPERGRQQAGGAGFAAPPVEPGDVDIIPLRQRDPVIGTIDLNERLGPR